MTEPSARVLLDSVSGSTGHRLTTFEVVMHRFVLAEFNTHRVFSRNSASSRAIPVGRQLARVTADPAWPLAWPAEQSGMQGGDDLPPEVQEHARGVWGNARNQAVAAAQVLAELGVHKSVTNRLLEPFMWHTVIVTATDWDGFWAQRCSPLAQPEIRAAAEAMRDAYQASNPDLLDPGTWHLPLIQDDERDLPDMDLLRVSVARCARVSYLTHDGHRSIEADLMLYERLAEADPPHASPFEHVATPRTRRAEQRGNLQGWDQLRHRVFPTTPAP